ncbi:MAG: L-serine ammonia-lyase, iron-sulfur-dependent, subunit alpha [Oscillospiraceae bacterium]
MGCTEPIAIAYCAAYAVKTLGRMPERFEVACSGNIIKNVKAVTVPQTGGLKGIEAAVLAGAVGGNADAELEVLSGVTDADIKKMHELMKEDIVKVKLLDTVHALHIVIDCFAGSDEVSVEIIDTHTGIGNVTKNGKVLHERKNTEVSDDLSERRELNLKDILTYGDEVNLNDVREVLERQIKYNTAISDEGLANSWGACVGQVMMDDSGKTDRTRIVARAAAGSDARMNGCAMPVVINSGSGNQGMTVSLPVIEYAAIKKIPHDKLLRGLCVSNLTAIHQKTDIGRLSAFCGAVSAATGSAVGIAYLDGADYETIAQTITNSLGTIGGMVCDGAKSSCATKIVSALQCALLGYDMAKQHHGFMPGEGIVKPDVEQTIASVGRMASKGMNGTDIEVLNIMIEN